MIYLLSEDPSECAKMLSDADLDKQIIAIAQVLCNAHWLRFARLYSPNAELFESLQKTVPLKEDKHLESPYSYWAQECRANYLKLVEMGLRTCEEYNYRYGLNVEHKLFKVILWARDNVPIFDFDKILDNYVNIGNDIAGLLSEQTTSFPLVMPYKYKPDAKLLASDDFDFIGYAVKCYRNYYRAILKKKYFKLIKCKDCNTECDGECNVCFDIDTGKPTGFHYNTDAIKYTRRTPPAWLDFEWEQTIP